MDTRRDFIKKAMLLSGATGFSAFMPASIQKALAIDPARGSTYLDAEHVVILMQENRSFDHCFGTLSGVRGYNDPHVVKLPNNNKAWLQTNALGETYAPFRLNIKDSKATWMGALPHGRSNQVDANNLGKFDQWLESKRSPNKQYADMPLTMGHYTREDVPFNYALADAFTVCDQNFSSAMTSTFPNRSFLWTGTIREKQDGESKAHMRNGDFKYNKCGWKTFPERLEENNVTWKVYQNDIYCGGGYEGEEKALLGNFGCNPLEYFESHNVKFSANYLKSLNKQINELPPEINALKAKAADPDTKSDLRAKTLKDITIKEKVLAEAMQELKTWGKENYSKLSPAKKNLHDRAFTNNSGDPDYRKISSLKYMDGTVEREATIPKGDLLHQFRADVTHGKLPVVSWIVPPGRFSDHPSAPWYGAWYVSEVMDILTKDPEVWKKTIFILTYDENDGYFDHIPPFVAPNPKDPETGKCSEGIDTSVEFVRLEQELKEEFGNDAARGGPIGLGYRVPMIIASPWSRGGRVCSQVFDHTSSLRFLEVFIGHKLGRDIRESNISEWRRTVCGDLTSVFNPFNGKQPSKLPFIERDPFIETLYNARFKALPSGFKKLSADETEQINSNPSASPYMPKQEPGIRESCALPYQLYADGTLSSGKKHFKIMLEARQDVFGTQAAGSPFNIYSPGRSVSAKNSGIETAPPRSYAVAAGKNLTDTWALDTFANGNYHFLVYGPNGFLREFKGNSSDPLIKVSCEYEHNDNKEQQMLSGRIALKITNTDPSREIAILIKSNAYKKISLDKVLTAAGSNSDTETIIIDSKADFNWYDFSIKAKDFDQFEKRYAGRVETGQASYTDPVMGQI